MAIQSMTGYGRSEHRDAHYSVAVEIKSVNNRFLEFQFRNSKELLHLEQHLKNELGKHVQRGSVSCHLHYESQNPEAGELALNDGVLQAYARIIASAQKILPQAQIQLGDILRLPDVVVSRHTQETPETVRDRVLPVFRQACEELVESRGREGDALAVDLKRRIDAFLPALDKVKSLIPERQEEYAGKMRAKVQEIIGDHVISEDRLMTEIGLMAERLDVTEEIVRLSTHLHHFLETLGHHRAPGKRLGFLLQEMLREVNTLGTKSQYADIQHICIGWKEDLEILREQIQNLE